MHVTDMPHMSAGSSHHSPDHADAQKQLHKNAAGQAAQQPQDPTQSGSEGGAGGAQQPDPPQQPNASSVTTTSAQEAAQSSGDDSSASPRVPPELRAMTTFLRGQGRLRTTGLFVNSADAAMLWAMHQPPEQSAAESNREPKAGCALAVRQIREALDRGQEVMPHAFRNGIEDIESNKQVGKQFLQNMKPKRASHDTRNALNAT